MAQQQTLTAALAVLVSQGLAHADKALLVKVAKTLWYSDEVPELGQLPVDTRADAGYVVDRLIRVNVVSKERKLQVLAAIEPYRRSEPPAASPCKDPLALAWGATGDLTSFLPELTPHQTRQASAMRRS